MIFFKRLSHLNSRLWQSLRILSTVSLAFSLAGCTIIRSDDWPVNEKKIILSFDDGPSEEISLELLRVLKKYNVKATFCYVGRNVVKHPEVVKQSIDQGHEIAIHSYSRRFATFFEYEPLVKDVEDTRNAIRLAADSPNIDLNLYRPPSGLVTLPVRKLLKEQGLNLAYLSFYIHDAPIEPDKAEHFLKKMKKAIAKRGGGAIVFHESRFKTALDADNTIDKSWLPGAIGSFIIWAKKNDYEFVSFSDLST